MLDKFQAEIGKRILRLPRYHSNISVLLGLKWPSFRLLVLVRKLSYLAKLLSDNSNCTSSRVFRSLASENLFDIGLVQQCKELELLFGTNILEQCLLSPDEAIATVQQAMPHLIEADWNRSLHLGLSHPSLTYICNPALVGDWCNLWNTALDFGTRGTKVAQGIFRVLSKPVFGEKICPFCQSLISESTFTDHLSSSHDLLKNQLLSSLMKDKSALFLAPIVDNILQFC